jgi:hypothetical protein
MYKHIFDFEKLSGCFVNQTGHGNENQMTCKQQHSDTRNKIKAELVERLQVLRRRTDVGASLDAWNFEPYNAGDSRIASLRIQLATLYEFDFAHDQC